MLSNDLTGEAVCDHSLVLEMEERSCNAGCSDSWVVLVSGVVLGCWGDLL